MTLILSASGTLSGNNQLKAEDPVSVFFEYGITSETVSFSGGINSLITGQDRVNLFEEMGITTQQYTFDIYPDPTNTETSRAYSTGINSGIAEQLDDLVYSGISSGTTEVFLLLEDVLDNTGRRSLDLSFTQSNVDSTTTYLSGVVSSLRNHCETGIDLRIENLNISALPIYSEQNHISGIYTRNTGCWIHDISTNNTCISPYNSDSSNRKAGTLITPRHIIFAAHYQYPTGTTIRFVTKDNVVIDKTLIQKKTDPSYTPFYPDFTVGLLDGDVGTGITGINPCKVLPDNWANYLPTDIELIPSLGLDQEEKATIQNGRSINGSSQNTFTSFIVPINSQRSLFYETKISGDSGNPAFLIISGELVLLTVWTFGGAGSGTSITSLKSNVNQLILDVDSLAGISTGYTLNEIDISSFTDFS